VVVQPTPSYLANLEPASTVFVLVLQEQVAGMTRAVSWAHQALADHTWNSCCWGHTRLVNVRTVQSGKYGNCTVTVKIPEIYNTDCGQDGDLLMPKASHLETL